MLGIPVTGNPYPGPPGRHGPPGRPPEWGRAILGIAAGWSQRDFDEYGYPYGTAASRPKAWTRRWCASGARLGRLNPPQVGQLPILVG